MNMKLFKKSHSEGKNQNCILLQELDNKILTVLPKELKDSIEKVLPEGMPKKMAEQIAQIVQNDEAIALFNKMPKSMFKSMHFAPKSMIKKMHSHILQEANLIEKNDNLSLDKAQEEFVPLTAEMEEQLPKEMLDMIKSTMPQGITNEMAKNITEAMQNNMFQTHVIENPDDLTQYYAKENVEPLAYAFDKKISVHAGINGQIVPLAEVQKTMEMLSHTKREGKSTLYVHIPFCETHCLYCGFFLKPFREDFSKFYTDALIREIEMWAGREIYNAPVHAVYFGGGTPTALNAKDLERILKALKKHINLANDCEITIEGRLHNFGSEKIEACLRGSANRFSLGVQTFDTEIRQKMGRIADKENVCKMIEHLLSYDQAAVVIDLIYGFPMQTMEKWQEDLRIAKSLNLDGLDCYQLNVFASTPLGKLIENKKLPASATIPVQSEMFKYAVQSLEEDFYSRLSMNHFARTSRERNIYNQFAKGAANTLSFGACAGGGIREYSYMHHRTVDEWFKAVEANQKPVMGLQVGDENAIMYKAISQSMEQGYLDLSAIASKYHVDLMPYLKEILEQWQNVGLINLNKEKFSLTIAGQFWYVNLSQLLLMRLKNSL